MSLIRFLFRVLATLALAVAVIMAVLDATRSIAASALVVTPLATSWASASPDTLLAVQDFVSTRLHPLLWEPVVSTLIGLPGFVVLGAIAFLLYALGRRVRHDTGAFAV